GDPIYSIGHGIVVYSQDYQKGWGNVIIIRHAYRAKDGQITYIDSLYGHLQKREKFVGDQVSRGEKIGTMGRGPRNMYLAHLHFEIRKNLQVGMNRTRYPKDFTIYYSPKHFIRENRDLRYEPRKVPVPINTFGKSNPNVLTSKPLELPDLAAVEDRPEAPEPVKEVVSTQTKPDTATSEESRNLWDRVMGLFTGPGE
ncbi:MAG: M23 family metallopeptidase, partial [Verrucomicrobiales bacterium]|nr:M23 family metallopeptidase [Verrucomicrobiales bacterium]